VHRGEHYRATAIPRRDVITKSGWEKAPTGGGGPLEDKIVQRSRLLASLNAIYEEEFLGSAYGFRSKRGQHDAMMRWSSESRGGEVETSFRQQMWPLFRLSHQQRWLVRFVEHPASAIRGLHA